MLTLLLVPAPGLAKGEPAPLIQTLEDGEIDWSTRTLRVIGVGTPRVLSATGGLTTEPPYAMARADAEKRLERLLSRVPFDAKRRLRDVDYLDAGRKSALARFTADDVRYFSDGTVHMPARLNLQWLTAPGKPAVGKDADAGAGDAGVGDGLDSDVAARGEVGPTGILIQVRGKIAPTFRLTLKRAGSAAKTYAGMAGDPVGASGVFWVTDSAVANTLVGARPHLIVAQPSPNAAAGTLVVEDAAMWDIVATGVPGAVAVILEP